MIKVIASGSKGNCYLIQANENEKLLIECGIAWKDIVCNLDFNLDGIQGCLVTHAHFDHSKSIKDILHYGIDVYCNENVVENVKFVNSFSTRRMNLIKPKRKIKIGCFTILPFDCQHTNNDRSACQNLGFIIEHKEIGKIVFVTDTYYLKYKFKDIDHVLIECNYSEKDIQNIEPYRARIFKSHMSLETLKETLKAWDLKKTKDITLIHLSENNADENYMKEEIEKLTGIPVYIARKGLVIDG